MFLRKAKFLLGKVINSPPPSLFQW